jgi:hypothetical protein
VTPALPADAFSYYAALGSERTLTAVAKHFGVKVKVVVDRAAREEWAQRVEAIEREARQRVDEQLVDLLEEMDLRHLKIARALQAKALRALQEGEIRGARDAIRALDLGVRSERLLSARSRRRREAGE